MGSVAKYSASRKHSTVVSSPGQNPPYAALSKTKGRYVIYGIRSGSRGNRAICAASGQKECGRRQRPERMTDHGPDVSKTE